MSYLLCKPTMNDGSILCLIMFIFLSVATLGFGKLFLVKSFKTFEVSLPDTLIIAMPEIPGPLERE